MMILAMTMARPERNQPDQALPPSFAGNAGSRNEFSSIGVIRGLFFRSRRKSQAPYDGPVSHESALHRGRWRKIPPLDKKLQEKGVKGLSKKIQH
jgi:hypothetical protein